MTLQTQLKQILVTELNIRDIPPETIDDDEPIFGDRLGLDSIDALEMVYQVEQHFGISIKDKNEARTALQTINTLTAYITARLPN
ncbi:phosphopantetheine-binding protein [Desulfosarcina ovata]|uniref:Acyl carrier protein n=2 Tax=Desulfosarcina ovata TaxID=83564 RepID=A0A5K8AE23_9BACT|nr:phosphopantetheine-binding protein [Desulfosarcina ovata]BBO84316.1 acyl carrier protein [Desulfosarcina ovata subsp. sediminis]BBO90827.1 acyl carrier protein [Desulfosarcina ovata subsp. ovata]